MKKNQRGFGAVEVLLILIVIAILGFGGWYIYHARTDSKKDKTTTQPTTSSSTTTATKSSGASLPTVVADIKSSILAQYASYVTLTPSNNSVYSNIVYTVPGVSYIVATDSTEKLQFNGNTSTTTQATIDQSTTSIASILKDNGFSYVNNPPVVVKDPSGITGGLYDNPDTGYYTRSDNICLLGSAYPTAADVVTLGCAPTKALASAAVSAKPFVAGYNAAKANTGSVAFATPTITTLKTGYKYATMPAVMLGPTHSLGDGEVLYFYTNSSGANWQYATGSEEGIACSELTTPDAKQALSGICVSEF